LLSMSNSTITSGSNSCTVLRVLACVVALACTAFALLLVRNQVRVLAENQFDIIGVVFLLVSATIATLCWWFTVRGHVPGSERRLTYAVFGACILGGIGFWGGFVGPLYLSPGANQGPLLGIFFTGPLGFALGAVIGWIYAGFATRQVNN
jgi:hypothetical protein